MIKSQNNRKTLILWSTLVVFISLAIVAWAFHHQAKPNTNTDSYRPKASEGHATEPSGGTNGSPTPTIAPNNTPASNPASSITITSPTQGGTVASGTTVKGTARVTATKLYFRLKAGKSGQLASGVIGIPASPNSPVGYSFELQFTNQVYGGLDQGNLETYTLDANGVESNVVSLLVNIQG